ncbi:MAG: OmpA family protein [Parasporobacterium sp.]|nr:OmpA family protein [Parasporobacterium sp.]
MKIRRNRRKSEDEETSYWLSYSDMMAGLLLVFVLIISFTILQAKAQYEAKEEELAEQALIIFAQQEELTDKETQLGSQQSQLEEQQSQLEEQQSQLALQQDLLTQQQTELDEQKSAVEVLRELLANQEALLAEKEALVGEQQQALESQQEQLDRIIGVKTDLIEALKTRFDSTNLSVSVDSKTGAITMDSSILFELDEYDLSEAGQRFLTQFIPVYLEVLMSPDFSGYISEIIIEGHTDTEGDYMYNLELSQQRALAVATFCLSEDNQFLTETELETLRNLVTANGRSFSDPVYGANGQIDMDASRRVEFKFRLNDEDMVQEMIDILNEDNQNN